MRYLVSKFWCGTCRRKIRRLCSAPSGGGESSKREFPGRRNSCSKVFAGTSRKKLIYAHYFQKTKQIGLRRRMRPITCYIGNK